MNVEGVDAREATMLFRPNMVDMKPEDGEVFLPQAAVFTPITSSLPNEHS